MIYICIPVFNRLKYTILCVESILRLNDDNLKIIICDDASQDGTYAYITQNYPMVVVLKGDGNLWWTGGTNLCVKYVLSICKADDYIFTLNNDTEVTPTLFSNLRATAKKFPNAIIGGLSLFISDKRSIEITAFKAKKTFPFSKYHKPIFDWGTPNTVIQSDFMEVDSLSGKGVLIPVKVFDTVGLYNAEKLPHYHADTEFTRRAKDAGVFLVVDFQAVIYSHQELSGIGQVNGTPNLMEFVRSFNTLRSSNDLRTMANRARIIYGKKWRIYMFFNFLKICFDFSKRYLRAIFNRLFIKN
jgi:GT2 family glycosyltransferase